MVKELNSKAHKFFNVGYKKQFSYNCLINSILFDFLVRFNLYLYDIQEYIILCKYYGHGGATTKTQMNNNYNHFEISLRNEGKSSIK